MNGNGIAGSVAELWRYPVKSMLGEQLGAAKFGEAGVLGDRAYALVDRATGKVASAKNPRKWPHLFAFSAVFTSDPAATRSVPPVRITSPDGELIDSGQADVDAVLSAKLQRDVTLRSITDARARGAAAAEEYWPDIEGLDHRDTVTDFDLPQASFFDAASVLVLTKATLERLHRAYAQGRFDVRRFRPNVVVDTTSKQDQFVENAWVGRTLEIGAKVRLHVTGPCARCVMTTLAQGDLPNDLGILRTAATENGANVGVYATVVRGGEVRQGDRLTLG